MFISGIVSNPHKCVYPGYSASMLSGRWPPSCGAAAPSCNPNTNCCEDSSYMRSLHLYGIGRTLWVKKTMQRVWRLFFLSLTRAKELEVEGARCRQQWTMVDPDMLRNISRWYNNVLNMVACKSQTCSILPGLQKYSHGPQSRDLFHADCEVVCIQYKSFCVRPLCTPSLYITGIIFLYCNGYEPLKGYIAEETWHWREKLPGI